MITRKLSSTLTQAAKKLPLIALTGPRQSGKTTLARSVFSDKPYVSLENLDTRTYATSDPRGFLAQFPRGAVLDEIQRAPELFSYIQVIVDEKREPGFFILTGSQQFLMMENLSQTLAGRVRTLNLLPLSIEELSGTEFVPNAVNKLMLKGFYPRLYDQALETTEWYPDYLRTYVERDVRLIKNIGNIEAFHRFLKLCAARTGQLLNLSSLAIECGIKHATAKAWISVLEASFIVHLLRPHHRNFNKRVIKTPKLYFYDTGLACALLEIENEKQLKLHPLRAHLFETAIVSELIKYRLNRGLPANLYFWQDKTGHEIDCVIDRSGSLKPIEIKSGQTITEEYFRNLKYWGKLSGQKSEPSFLIYGGSEDQQRGSTFVASWKNAYQIFERIDVKI